MRSRPGAGDEDEQERHEADERGDVAQTATPSARLGDRESRAGGVQEAVLASADQLVRALDREAEDQAQRAAPATAAERERIDRESCASIGSNP